MNVAMAANASYLHFKPEIRHCISSSPCSSSSTSSIAHASSLSCKLLSTRSRRPIVLCNSRATPGGSSSGENESQNILDAFFLGKALAEALNERIESTVGEFLSTIGRLQAEQQKQIQDFQEEVHERAKRAKEKAARESMEAPGLIAKDTAAGITSVTDGGAASSPPSSSSINPSNAYSESNAPSNSSTRSPESRDTALDMLTED